MPVRVLLVAVGLALFTIAADHLVLGSSRLAMRLRIPPVVVGVVVIGAGDLGAGVPGVGRGGSTW